MTISDTIPANSLRPVNMASFRHSVGHVYHRCCRERWESYVDEDGRLVHGTHSVSVVEANTIYLSSLGQRIVARLRERTYSAALVQEVEYVEKGEGDVLSRLSVDTSIVGERYVFSLSLLYILSRYVKCNTEPFGRLKGCRNGLSWM